MANPSLLDLYDAAGGFTSTVSGDIVPNASQEYTLGTPEAYWQAIYTPKVISNSTVYVRSGDQIILQGQKGALTRVWAGASNHAVVLHGNRIVAQNYADTGMVPMNASAFTQNSSLRYKENIKDISLEEVKKLYDVNVVTYNYKTDENKEERCGVIVEQLADIGLTLPIVYDDDGRPDGVNYPDLVPYLIKVVQEQKNEISTLKEKADKFDRLSALLVEKDIITKDELENL